MSERIMLDEEQFRTLVNGGVITVEIPPRPAQLREGMTVEIALSDIGFSFMKQIIGIAGAQSHIERIRTSEFMGFSIGDRKILSVNKGELTIVDDASSDDLRSTISYLVSVIGRLLPISSESQTGDHING